jgi:hypothetical protein
VQRAAETLPSHCTIQPSTPHCRGPSNAPLYARVSAALAVLVEHYHDDDDSENANRPKQGIDLSLNGYMHTITPLAATLPKALQPPGETASNSKLGGTAARTLVDDLLQLFAEKASARLAPQMPAQEAMNQLMTNLGDPLAFHARNATKPKPVLPVPKDEVCVLLASSSVGCV